MPKENFRNCSRRFRFCILYTAALVMTSFDSRKVLTVHDSETTPNSALDHMNRIGQDVQLVIVNDCVFGPAEDFDGAPQEEMYQRQDELGGMIVFVNPHSHDINESLYPPFRDASRP
jgi:hypothetical protein